MDSILLRLGEEKARVTIWLRWFHIYLGNRWGTAQKIPRFSVGLLGIALREAFKDQSSLGLLFCVIGVWDL
jgi:hypothetical protein